MENNQTPRVRKPGAERRRHEGETAVALHLFWRDEKILEQDSGGVA